MGIIKACKLIFATSFVCLDINVIHFKVLSVNQHQIVGTTLLEFKRDLAYLTSHTIVAVDGSSQSVSEALVVKIELTCFLPPL